MQNEPTPLQQEAGSNKATTESGVGNNMQHHGLPAALIIRLVSALSLVANLKLIMTLTHAPRRFIR